MKRFSYFAALLLAACSPATSEVTRLGPLQQPSQAPSNCKILSVLPNSPAAQAGLQVGDLIESVNGTKPPDASAVSDMIQRSDTHIVIEVAGAGGTSRFLKVALNKEKPRLGASCDLSGWRKSGVTAAGNESITIFQGPYAVTVSGIFDKGLAFLRVRVSNHSDHPVAVSPVLFSVKDGNQAALKVLSPPEVIYFMHGEDGISFIQPPSSGTAVVVSSDSLVRQNPQRHKKKADWTASDQSYVEANAKYLSKESLWPETVPPGGVTDGLIYFLEPKSLPVRIRAQIEGSTLDASFGTPVPSTQRMSAEELIVFFNATKKGMPVRLTLKNGKVFVGRFSSFDSIDEIVWFDTPSGGLLTTSSFGLKHIVDAVAVTPDAEKKPTTAEPLN